MEQYIGRIVAFVLTPILLTVVTPLAVWAQAKLGVHLDPAEVVAYIVTIGTGIALVAYKWLHNRGEFEKGVQLLENLHAAGQVPAPVDPKPVA